MAAITIRYKDFQEILLTFCKEQVPPLKEAIAKTAVPGETAFSFDFEEAAAAYRDAEPNVKSGIWTSMLTAAGFPEKDIAGLASALAGQIGDLGDLARSAGSKAAEVSQPQEQPARMPVVGALENVFYVLQHQIDALTNDLETPARKTLYQAGFFNRDHALSTLRTDDAFDIDTVIVDFSRLEENDWKGLLQQLGLMSYRGEQLTQLSQEYQTAAGKSLWDEVRNALIQDRARLWRTASHGSTATKEKLQELTAQEIEVLEDLADPDRKKAKQEPVEEQEAQKIEADNTVTDTPANLYLHLKSSVAPHIDDGDDAAFFSPEEYKAHLRPGFPAERPITLDPALLAEADWSGVLHEMGIDPKDPLYQALTGLSKEDASIFLKGFAEELKSAYAERVIDEEEAMQQPDENVGVQSGEEQHTEQMQQVPQSVAQQPQEQIQPVPQSVVQQPQEQIQPVPQSVVQQPQEQQPARTPVVGALENVFYVLQHQIDALTSNLKTSARNILYQVSFFDPNRALSTLRAGDTFDISTVIVDFSQLKENDWRGLLQQLGLMSYRGGLLTQLSQEYQAATGKSLWDEVRNALIQDRAHLWQTVSHGSLATEEKLQELTAQEIEALNDLAYPDRKKAEPQPVVQQPAEQQPIVFTGKPLDMYQALYPLLKTALGNDEIAEKYLIKPASAEGNNSFVFHTAAQIDLSKAVTIRLDTQTDADWKTLMDGIGLSEFSPMYGLFSDPKIVQELGLSGKLEGIAGSLARTFPAVPEMAEPEVEEKEAAEDNAAAEQPREQPGTLTAKIGEVYAALYAFLTAQSDTMDMPSPEEYNAQLPSDFPAETEVSFQPDKLAEAGWEVFLDDLGIDPGSELYRSLTQPANDKASALLGRFAAVLQDPIPMIGEEEALQSADEPQEAAAENKENPQPVQEAAPADRIPAPGIPRIIHGTPAYIYQEIYNLLKKESPAIDLLPLASYQNDIHSRFPKFDFETPISIDLSQLGEKDGWKKVMNRLGFRVGDEPDRTIREISALTERDPDVMKRLFDTLADNKTLQPMPVDNVNDAKRNLMAGEYVNLQNIAQLGSVSGYIGSVGLLDESLKEADRQSANEDQQALQTDTDRLEALLSGLNETGTIIGSTEYSNVRTALSNVIKLHKDLARYMMADPRDSKKSAELARKAPDSRQLEEAYAALDQCANTYLWKKLDRLNRRVDRSSPDPRGQKRYNIIASMRTITNPEFRQKAIQRMRSLDDKLAKDRDPNAAKALPQNNRQLQSKVAPSAELPGKFNS